MLSGARTQEREKKKLWGRYTVGCIRREEMENKEKLRRRDSARFYLQNCPMKKRSEMNRKFERSSFHTALHEW